MLKIAIAEIDINNNKKCFFIAICKLVKVVYIYQNRKNMTFCQSVKNKSNHPYKVV
jgi:hypothetical protein